MLAVRRGFTLIEVLVTLVILMFGLLGIVGLMAKGQKASYEAYQRQMALSLASDMVERIQSNKTQAAAYALAATPPGQTVGTGGARYTALVTGALTPNCGADGAVCNGTELTAYDLALWEGLLQGYGERSVAGATTLIGGVIGARGCIEQVLAPVACPAPSANPPFTRTTYRVSVAWQGFEDLGAVNFPTTCGANLYGLPGQRRVVALDLLVMLACPGI